jgi:hypothetical protein
MQEAAGEGLIVVVDKPRPRVRKDRLGGLGIFVVDGAKGGSGRLRTSFRVGRNGEEER